MNDVVTPPVSAAEAIVSPPAAPPAFYESFENADLKDWASKSGAKSAEEIAARAHKFDAFKDVDPANLLQLPEKLDDPNAVSAILERIGAPKEASAYGLDKIEGVDVKFAGAMSEAMAKAKLLPWQAQILAEAQMGYSKAEMESTAGEDRAAGERELASLKTKEWAGKYDEQLGLAQRALRVGAMQAGVSAEEAKQFVSFMEQGAGTAVAMKIAAFFGGFIKEGDFVEGGAKAPPPKNMAESWYAD